MLLYGRLRIKNKHARIVRDNLLLESQQLQTEIDYKNRELATNVLYLVKKNELINLISEKLLKAKPRFTPEIQPMIQKIILDLQANVDSDIWKSFEQRFIVVQKDFYEKLNQRFPNLTENERKLCALLRLKMSTKDIAAITHQNLNAIEVARTRLRKKLNLSNQNINLVTFLDNL
jgi:DNA-binding NarL/FixJ family response regulator